MQSECARPSLIAFGFIRCCSAHVVYGDNFNVTVIDFLDDKTGKFTTRTNLKQSKM